MERRLFAKLEERIGAVTQPSPGPTASPFMSRTAATRVPPRSAMPRVAEEGHAVGHALLRLDEWNVSAASNDFASAWEAVSAEWRDSLIHHLANASPAGEADGELSYTLRPLDSLVLPCVDQLLHPDFDAIRRVQHLASDNE